MECGEPGCCIAADCVCIYPNDNSLYCCDCRPSESDSDDYVSDSEEDCYGAITEGRQWQTNRSKKRKGEPDAFEV
jgi:hypothetical protein